jgi:F0F1-type ATP synthase membrane subunit c/vacuolar-type H+-ATPase subunit K
MPAPVRWRAPAGLDSPKSFDEKGKRMNIEEDRIDGPPGTRRSGRLRRVGTIAALAVGLTVGLTAIGTTGQPGTLGAEAAHAAEESPLVGTWKTLGVFTSGWLAGEKIPGTVTFKADHTAVPGDGTFTGTWSGAYPNYTASFTRADGTNGSMTWTFKLIELSKGEGDITAQAEGKGSTAGTITLERTSAVKKGCRTVTVERKDKFALSPDAGSEAAKRAYKYVHQHLGIPFGSYATSVVATLDFCWDSTKVLDGAATSLVVTPTSQGALVGIQWQDSGTGSNPPAVMAPDKSYVKLTATPAFVSPTVSINAEGAPVGVGVSGGLEWSYQRVAGVGIQGNQDGSYACAPSASDFNTDVVCTATPPRAAP